MKTKIITHEKMEKLAELLHPYWKDIENPDEHINKLRNNESETNLTITQTIDEMIQNEYLYDISNENTSGDNFAIGITAVKTMLETAIKYTIEECGKNTEWYFKIYPNVLSILFDRIPTDRINISVDVNEE